MERLSSAAPVTVAACAPLSNVARYVDQPGVTQIVMVGGELAPAPEPEFNVGHDATSAARVLAGDTPLTVYTADVFETVVVPPAVVSGLRDSAGPAARLAGDLLAVRRSHLLGDAGALVLLARPELFEVRPLPMAVVAGQLVPDPAAGRTVDVVVAADVPAVVDAFVTALEGAVTGVGRRL